jgi:acyl-CoA synthetase (AMP-forming)/AMP-acid ligase II
LPEATITGLLRQHAHDAPDGVFCTFISSGTVETITFESLYRKSRAYADEFLRRDIAPGDVVPIILKHSPHLFYAFLGTMLAGGVPTFMPFPSPKQRSDFYWLDHAALFARLHPRLIVTYGENLAAAQEALPDFAIETLLAQDALSDREPAGLDRSYPGLDATPSGLACLQHSSGTTGLKKGVMLTHGAITGQVSAYADALSFTAADSIASWLPLYHDMGFIACFLMSLINGTHLVMLDPFEWVLRPSLLLDAIERYRSSFCWLPNFAFSHIVNTTRPAKQYDLSSIRAFINCSEPCKATTFERFLERFGSDGVAERSLQVCYAMAENVFAVTQTDVRRPATVLQLDADAFSRGLVRLAETGDERRTALSCGRLIDGVGVQVCDERGLPVAPDRIGEIRVSGNYLFSGYYLQPDLTQAKVRDGSYATGDMGFIHADELFVTGRVDDMIIVNGRNFYAHDIEAVVDTVPGAVPGRSVAIGVDDKRSDATVLVILVETRGDPSENFRLVQGIREELIARLGLAAHSVLALANGVLSKTTSGKISRVKNRELYLQGAFK